MHSFNWENFLKLSEDMINLKTSRETKEALYRTICSRCYYAVFKQLEDFLRENGKVSNKSSHTEVLKYLSKEIRRLESISKKILIIKKAYKSAQTETNPASLHDYYYVVNRRIKELREYKKYITRLKNKRECADYRRYLKIKKKDAEKSIELCKKTLKLWQTLFLD